MQWWHAVVLGLVEGLTEYLPVSSTGHLLVVQALLGIGTEGAHAKEAADAYAICIQSGAILAVLGVFWRRILSTILIWPVPVLALFILWLTFLQPYEAGAVAVGTATRDSSGFIAIVGVRFVLVAISSTALLLYLIFLIVLLLNRAKNRRSGVHEGPIHRELSDGLALGTNLAAAFVPAVVLGLGFNKLIKSYLFGPWPVVAAWLLGGLAILVVVRWQGAKKAMPQAGLTLDQITLKMAVLIGVVQCLAMWPGTSRSLVTILAGLLMGLSMMAAVEFAFLLGVITLGAATVYDFLKHGDLMLEMYGPANLAIGFVVALVSAAVAVKWMVAYLNRHSLAVFGWYRLAIAVVVAALLAAGIM